MMPLILLCVRRWSGREAPCSASLHNQMHMAESSDPKPSSRDMLAEERERDWRHRGLLPEEGQKRHACLTAFLEVL